MQITLIESNLGVPAILARELYTELGLSKEHYTQWFKTQCLPFTEGADYLSFMDSGENSSKKVDHAISVDMAKHIALSSNTEQGRIYRQALIDLENKISKLPEPTKGHTMLPLWEAERDLGLEALQAAHKVKMASIALEAKDIQQRSLALDQRKYVLIDGMKVKTDMQASKVTLPVVPITALIQGTKLSAAQANLIMYGMGLLERSTRPGSNWSVTEAGSHYGRNQSMSKLSKTIEPRWFEGTDLIERILEAWHEEE